MGSGSDLMYESLSVRQIKVQTKTGDQQQMQARYCDSTPSNPGPTGGCKVGLTVAAGRVPVALWTSGLARIAGDPILEQELIRAASNQEIGIELNSFVVKNLKTLEAYGRRSVELSEAFREGLRALLARVSATVSNRLSHRLSRFSHTLSQPGAPRFLEDAIEGFDTPTATGFELGGLYPNPASRRAQIEFSLEEPASILVTVSDIIGRTHVLQSSGVFSSGSHEFPLDLDGLTNGVYIVSVRVGSERPMQPLTLVVQR